MSARKQNFTLALSNLTAERRTTNDGMALVGEFGALAWASTSSRTGGGKDAKLEAAAELEGEIQRGGMDPTVG